MICKNYLNAVFLFNRIKGRDTYLNKMYVETTKRGDILALTISGIEILFIIRLLFLYGAPQNMPILERHYFYAYASLLVMMILIYGASKHILAHPSYSFRFKRYATLVVCEGTVLPLIYISWLDQYAYGQVSVYFCALICIALYPLLEPIWSLGFLIINQIIFSIGIMVYQPDPLIASAHIMNTIPFIVFMWLISRQFFKNKLHEYEDADTIRRQRDELYQLYNEESLTDDLTHIGNRRFIRKRFDALRATCIHDHKPMTLMFIDGDDLKSINDQFGHSSGDAFLKVIAEALKKHGSGSNAEIGRYGGDEFILIAKDMSMNLARETGENIRQYVQSHTEFKEGLSGTVSIGFIVISDSEIEDFNTVMSQADALMYSAKKMGKNKVVSL